MIVSNSFMKPERMFEEACLNILIISLLRIIFDPESLRLRGLFLTQSLIALDEVLQMDSINVLFAIIHLACE